MNGYLRPRETGDLKADRDSVMAEIVGDLRGIAATVGDMVHAMGNGTQPDYNSLDLVGDQITLIVHVLEELEGLA